MAEQQGASADAGRATHEPNPQAVSAVPVGIPSAVIEEFCEELTPSLASLVQKFSEDAYSAIMGDVQEYLKQNATFNIGSQFDAQQRELITAYKALRAVYEACSLMEAKDNANAVLRGYWSEERSAEYRAQAIEARRAETQGGSVVDESAVRQGAPKGQPA